ncbi:methyltransferase [Streptomyces sp. NBC_00199]|uniref:methyltransferase n=1 Tax=Streptomyces sp. NBC_00199 TaxID=2975678 RepID=UPI0022597407|nr:methyltransferase [Streptomyces sp. NBC_00199]MCX5265739.1 methyltransferase [Streptomyces sp. NBC_00199]
MSIMREFLPRPRLTGAVAPGSAALAQAVTCGLGLVRAEAVVELGPGTCAITGAIPRQPAPGARPVAVELHRVFAGRLAGPMPTQRRRSGPGFGRGPGDARPVPVDVIASGLPWTVVPQERQRRILDAAAGALGPSGRFSTFAYVHAA